VLVDPRLETYRWENSSGKWGVKPCESIGGRESIALSTLKLSDPPETFKAVDKRWEQIRRLKEGHHESQLDVRSTISSAVDDPLDPTILRNEGIGTPGKVRNSLISLFEEIRAKDPRKIFLEPWFQDRPAWEESFPHPTVTTYLCRRLVLGKTAAAMNTLLLKTYDITIKSSTGRDITEFGIDSYDDGAWLSKWRGKKFRELWEHREDIELARLKLERTTHIFRRLVDAKEVSDSPFVRNEWSRDISESEASKARSAIKKMSTWPNKRQEELDLLELEGLSTQGAYAFEMIQRSTDSYLQTVSAGEAQVANNQSRR
jgi:hypothetical protein